MSAEKGGYSDAENHKSKRNWGLILGTVALVVSVPAAVTVLFFGYAGYQHVKSGDKKS